MGLYAELESSTQGEGGGREIAECGWMRLCYRMLSHRSSLLLKSFSQSWKLSQKSQPGPARQGVENMSHKCLYATCVVSLRLSYWGVLLLQEAPEAFFFAKRWGAGVPDTLSRKEKASSLS